MKGCSKYKEFLMLDALEELGPEDQRTLEVHLKSCSRCRQERERLTGLLGGIKTAYDEVPGLPVRDAQTMIQKVQKRLSGENTSPFKFRLKK